MQRKLQGGWQPKDPVDGPNLWRVMIGDRILWISGMEAQDKPPTQTIVEFRDNALAFGESEWFLSFGAPLESTPSERLVSLVRAGLDEARNLGLPRAIADISSGWCIRTDDSPTSEQPTTRPEVQVADPERVREVLARAKRVLRLLPSKRIH